MRLLLVLAVFAILGLAGLGSATPPHGPQAQRGPYDSSAMTLDLRAAKGEVYHIGCKNSRDITYCPEMSLWQETHKFPGLQKEKLVLSPKEVYLPDVMLLG